MSIRKIVPVKPAAKKPEEPAKPRKKAPKKKHHRRPVGTRH